MAATTRVGWPLVPISWSPAWTLPIVVHPVGVGSGVSRARALPMAGRAAMTTIWLGCRPLVRASRSAKPVGTPVSTPLRLPMASISSRAPGMISDREW